MIGLDTNVLVRFLVEDDVDQAARAKAIVQTAIEGGDAIFLPTVVLCETAWVLDRAYRFRRDEIASALASLAAAKHVALEDADVVDRALAAYRRGDAGFPDYVIGEIARARGCRAVVTFDEELLREPGYERP